MTIKRFLSKRGYFRTIYKSKYYYSADVKGSRAGLKIPIS